MFACGYKHDELIEGCRIYTPTFDPNDARYTCRRTTTRADPSVLSTSPRSRPNPTRWRDGADTTFGSVGHHQPAQATIDYDVKVYSILADHAHRSMRPPPGSTTFDHSREQSTKFLDGVAKTATNHQPWTNFAFAPLVFSLGGLMSKDTASTVQRFKPSLKDQVYDGMMTRLSLALLQARTRFFEV